MAAEGIAGQEDDIHQHYCGSQAKAEMTVVGKRPERVDPEHHHEPHRQVHEAAVQVIQHKRQLALTSVPSPAAGGRQGRQLRGLALGATGRVVEERAVVGLAVVVAGGPEPQRDEEDEEGWGDRSAADRHLRRVERRQVLVELVAVEEHDGPQAVDPEEAEPEDHVGRVHPPQLPELGSAHTAQAKAGRHQPRTAMVSRTASAERTSSARSAGVSSTSMTSSPPAGPSLTGTPTTTPSRPYSPSRWMAQGRI